MLNNFFALEEEPFTSYGMLVISVCSLDIMIYSYLLEFRSGHLQNSILTAFGMRGMIGVEVPGQG